MVETSFDVDWIEYLPESDFAAYKSGESDDLWTWDYWVTVSVDVPDEFKDKHFSFTEDLIRDYLKTHISQRLGEPVVVVDFTAFYAGTKDPLRGNYEDYEDYDTHGEYAFMQAEEGKTRTFVVSSVDYDTGQRDDLDLPQDFTLTLDIDEIGDTTDMQEIADYLVEDISDETGWLVDGFYFQEKMPDGTLVDLDAEAHDSKPVGHYDWFRIFVQSDALGDEWSGWYDGTDFETASRDFDEYAHGWDKVQLVGYYLDDDEEEEEDVIRLFVSGNKYDAEEYDHVKAMREFVAWLKKNNLEPSDVIGFTPDGHVILKPKTQRANYKPDMMFSADSHQEICPHCSIELQSVELHESFVCPSCDEEIMNYRVSSVPAYEMGAEDLEFTDWANQESKSHGKVSLKEWADHEIKTHGGKMSFQDWAKHEDKSHIRRYGAESEEFEAEMPKREKYSFKPKDITPYQEAGWCCRNKGWGSANLYLRCGNSRRDITQYMISTMCMPCLQSAVSYATFEQGWAEDTQQFESEEWNWGGDPTGKLATALRKARIKAKEPKKPLKIEKLDAEYEVVQIFPNGYEQHISIADTLDEAKKDIDEFPHKWRHLGPLEIKKRAETSGQWEIGEQLEEAQMNAEDYDEDWSDPYEHGEPTCEPCWNWGDYDAGMAPAADHICEECEVLVCDGCYDPSTQMCLDCVSDKEELLKVIQIEQGAEGKGRKKISGALSDPFDELSLDSGGMKKVVVGVGLGLIALIGYNKWK